ncbi:MAG: hypothetical protein INQ03_12275 [Candidatus Heimdallarchaeota archaeon]|nr:hypothetical protein [Candidatus Heimdallarchaeota archaeon]
MRTMSENLKGSDHILKLPSAPVYLSIMKTLEGKPFGTPIWLSFEHKPEKSLENENIAATIISLSNNIAALTPGIRKEGKIVRLTVDNKSYNIFLPKPDAELQVSFVVVFEQSDTVLVEDSHREELIRQVVDRLAGFTVFKEYIAEDDRPIDKTNPLYRQIQDLIADVILLWDKKRVTYLKKQEEEERKRIAALSQDREEEF